MKGSPCPRGICPQSNPSSSQSQVGPQVLPAGKKLPLRSSYSAWRARKPTVLRTQREVQCSGRRPPRPGSTPPAGRGASRRRRLPVSSSHGSEQAGGDHALRLPSSSFPSQAHGSRRRLLPPLLQQPTSNRPLGATAQAPPPGADNARLRARTDVVTAARHGRGALLPKEGCLGSFFPLLLSPPLKG